MVVDDVGAGAVVGVVVDDVAAGAVVGVVVDDVAAGAVVGVVVDDVGAGVVVDDLGAGAVVGAAGAGIGGMVTWHPASADFAVRVLAAHPMQPQQIQLISCMLGEDTLPVLHEIRLELPLLGDALLQVARTGRVIGLCGLGDCRVLASELGSESRFDAMHPVRPLLGVGTAEIAFCPHGGL